MQGLTEHLGLKVFSLIVAIALWYFVIGDTEVGGQYTHRRAVSQSAGRHRNYRRSSRSPVHEGSWSTPEGYHRGS